MGWGLAPGLDVLQPFLKCVGQLPALSVLPCPPDHMHTAPLEKYFNFLTFKAILTFNWFWTMRKLLISVCNYNQQWRCLNHLWMQPMSLPMSVLSVTHVKMEKISWAKCSCGLLHVCHPLAGTTDQYFGRTQMARNVIIKSNDLKAIMEMQNSSHAGLSHSGRHLGFSVNKTIHLFSSVTATGVTKGSSNSSGTYQWFSHALHFLEKEKK